MSLRDFSSIARPVDPQFSTNRAIALISAVLFVGYFLYAVVAGSGMLASGVQAGGLGLSVFLSWALCREIDPDRDLSAFVAAGTAFVGALLWGLPDLAVVFWLLMAVRFVNRTTGLLATPLDSIGFVLLASWLAFRVWWPIGVFSAVVFLLDGWLERPLTRHRLLCFLALALTIGAGLLGTMTWSYHGPGWASNGIAILICILFVPVIVAARELATLADDTRERLNTTRVRAGQLLTLLFGVTAVFWTGAEGLVLLWPLWSALLGASAFLMLNSLLD